MAGLFFLGAAPGRAQPAWQSRDIGTATAGSTSTAGDTISISGSGHDIWNEQDGFRFYYFETSRDFDIVVHVRSITNTYGWAKAGIMARQSLDPGSPHATIVASVAHGTAFQWRQTANGASDSTTPAEDGGPPRWLRLTRRDEGGGSLVKGYVSADGVNWTQTTSQMVSFGPAQFVGLAVTSHVDGVLATAEFDQLTVTQPPAPASNLRVTHRGADGQIDLAWTDNSADETGFTIEARRERIHVYEPIGEVGPNVTAFSARGLSEGWGYDLRVKAVKGATSSYSETLTTGTTPEIAISSPAQTASSITVRIVERANFMGTSGGPYALERSTDGAAFAPIASGLRRTGGDVYTLICDYVDQAVTPGTRYSYRARYLDTNGDEGGYATLAAPVTTTTGATPPAAPGNLAAVAVSASEVRLTWTDNSNNETRFEIHRFNGEIAAGVLATVGPDITSYRHLGLSPGTTYTYRVVAANEAGTSAFSSSATATTPGAPSTWRDDDIGNVGAAGGTVQHDATYTVRGAGADIWEGDDAFHFYSRPLAGDGEIAVRVTALDNTDGWAKAGIMLRADNTGQSPYVFVYVNPSFQVAWQHRATAGGSPSFGSAYRWPPAWLKIVRAGNVFTVHYSDNGTNWILGQTYTLTLPAELRAGLAVTSHRRGTAASATFDSLTVQGAGGGPAEPPPATPAAPSGLTAAVVSSHEVRLTWTDNATNENAYEIHRGSGAGAKSLFATVGANSNTYADTNVAAGQSYTYSVRAVNSAGASGFSNDATATAGGGASWATADIGNAGLGGSLAQSGATLTVTGSGEDIWGGADGFFFAHQPLHGDGQIVARVQSLTDTHGWAKAGLMIRESLAPGAKHAFVLMTPHSGAFGHARSATGGATTLAEGPWWVSAPYWLKLVRQGAAITAYTSADGAAWTLLTTTNIDLAADAYIGLAVTAHDVGKRNVAEFTNVQVSGP